MRFERFERDGELLTDDDSRFDLSSSNELDFSSVLPPLVALCNDEDDEESSNGVDSFVAGNDELFVANGNVVVVVVDFDVDVDVDDVAAVVVVALDFDDDIDTLLPPLLPTTILLSSKSCSARATIASS